MFSGITYIELHQYITSFVSKIHDEIDLSSVFQNFNISENIEQFKVNEQLALIASSIVLVIQIFLLSTMTGIVVAGAVWFGYGILENLRVMREIGAEAKPELVEKSKDEKNSEKRT